MKTSAAIVLSAVGLAWAACRPSASRPKPAPASVEPAKGGYATRSFGELSATDDPAWPLVQQWITEAKNHVEVLPLADARAETLVGLQVTLHSTLGAVAYETGGILIDHGGNAAIVGAVPAVAAGGGWSTGLTVGARFFLPGRRFTAGGMAPFAALDAGALFVEEIDPFVIAFAGVGLRLPIGTRAAFTPQAGYLLVHATDDDVRFGDSRTEHSVAVTWSLSVFF